MRVETVSPYERLLLITISSQDVDRGYEEAFQELRKRLRLKGFRKGKVPEKVARQHLTPAHLAARVANLVVPRVYQQAIKSERLSPLGKPEWEIERNEPGHELIARARVQVLPILDLEGFWSFPDPPFDLAKPEARDDLVNTVLAGLVEAVQPEHIPPQLKEAHAMLELKSRTQALESQGLSLEQHLATSGKSIESFLEEVAARGLVEARLEILYRSVAAAESLVVTEREVDAAILTQHEPGSGTKARMMEDGSYRLLAYRVLISKVRAVVLAKAQAHWSRASAEPAASGPA
jgi:FKBP-type peptidyl-prolyl cis-trans isomerase (trigger factor)